MNSGNLFFLAIYKICQGEGEGEGEGEGGQSNLAVEFM